MSERIRLIGFVSTVFWLWPRASLLQSRPAVGEHADGEQNDHGCENVVLRLPAVQGQDGLASLMAR